MANKTNNFSRFK